MISQPGALPPNTFVRVIAAVREVDVDGVRAKAEKQVDSRARAAVSSA